MAPHCDLGERRANGEAADVLARLSPGDHLCIIYATEEEHRLILSQFVRHGLERGEKVLYIVDAHTARQMRRLLFGIDVKEAERRGQLALMTQAETYTSEGEFDPQRMISLLARETDRAQAEGYPALRVTGEMSWALRGLPGSERLIEYEAMLNEYLPGSACIGLCQYDRRKFSPEILLDVLRTHPIAVIGTQVHDNFYYVPPRELLGEDSAAAELARWLDGLAFRKQANDALRAQRDFSETLIQGSPVYFVAINPDGTTRLVNQAMLEALGYEQDEVLGQDYMETFVPKQDRPALREVFGELTQATQGTKNVNRVRAKDGRELLVEWHGRPVFDADDKLAYFFGVGLDITERERAAEELRAASRDLGERVKELRCLYEISQLTADHEQPLSSVLKRIVDLIPSGFARPEATGARLAVDDEGYESRRFSAQGCTLTVEVKRGVDFAGKLEISAAVESTEEQPFLPEERSLAEEIARRVGHHLERRHVRERLDHLNEVLRSIRDVNQLIVREQDAEQLVEDACRCLTSTRGFPTAWAALLEVGGAVRAWTASGLGDAGKLLVDRWREGYPPPCADEALQSGQVVAVSDIEEFCPGCPLAVERKGVGALAVRLEHEGKVFGVLSVAVPEQFLRDEEEQHLLAEVAGDLGLALHGIEREALLQESERRLTHLMENLPGMAYRCRNEPEWTMEFVSRGCRRLLGCDPEELVENRVRSYGDFVHPDDRERLWNEVQAGVRNGGTFAVTYRILDTQGRQKWLWEQGSAVFTNDGEVEALEGFITDVTERVRATEALQESEQRYRTLFEETANPILVIDTDGRYIDANEAALKFLECSREDLLQRNVRDMAPPETDSEEMLSEHRSLWERGGRTETEYFVNGSLKVLDLAITPGTWHGKRVIWGLGTDITERKHAEAALEESEERYRSLFQESPVALFEEDYSRVKEEMDNLRQAGVSDLEAYLGEHPEVLEDWISRVRFLNANRAAMELFGVGSMDELIALARRERMGPAAEAMRHEFVELFRGHTQVQHKGRARNVNGDHLETVVLLVVLGGHEQTLDRVLVSIQDMSEQVRSRDEAERTLARMERVFEGTVGALASVSEIRDPYTAGHQRGLAQLACAIARTLGLEEDRVQGIRVGALLHDIGKVSVPTEILNRPGKLGDLEYSMIQAHPQVGYDILKDIEFPWPVAEMVFQHHERLDGSGYPQGLTGEQIILEARILAVADVVEAMASHRPYRPAHGKEAALKEVRAGAGKLFDSQVVEACEKVFADGFVLDEGSHQHGL